MDEAKFRAAERRLWESVGTTPTELRVHLERNDVTVRVQQLGDGPPVLFLHSAMTSGASWTSLAARLRGFSCLLLDRPGCGLSDSLGASPTLETLPRFAETLVADVLDALDIESAHLVGCSFGGYFVLRSAAATPDRVRRIVQMSCPVGAPMARRPLAMRMMALPGAWRVLVVPPSERAVRMMFRQVGNGPSVEAGNISQEDIGAFLALLRHTDTRRHEMAMGRWFFTARGVERLVLTDEVLAAIRAPTYFYWGANDPFGGAETAKHLVDRMPETELEMVPGTGHAPWFDDLDHAAAVLDAFFARPSTATEESARETDAV